ncbi:MAG: class I SAM-dependent methyltransferase [Pseudomonadota bacterium]
MLEVTWDYTALAATYDKRGDYADLAIDKLLDRAAPDRNLPIADIGAGTGKLTKMLLARGFTVNAVEPNDAMRGFGIDNTAGESVVWSVGTGEATGLDASAHDLVTFGSSFNVTDRQAALKEVARLLKPDGWFACMWNHRNLETALQRACEDAIKQRIDDYGYGTRREDQTEVIRASSLFRPSEFIEESVVHQIPRADFMAAWASHGTLQRQAGDKFNDVIEAIDAAVPDDPVLDVEYTTRLWCAQLA